MIGFSFASDWLRRWRDFFYWRKQAIQTQLSVESNPGVHWFCFTTLCDWQSQSVVKQNQCTPGLLSTLNCVWIACFRHNGILEKYNGNSYRISRQIYAGLNADENCSTIDKNLVIGEVLVLASFLTVSVFFCLSVQVACIIKVIPLSRICTEFFGKLYLLVVYLIGT